MTRRLDWALAVALLPCACAPVVLPGPAPGPEAVSLLLVAGSPEDVVRLTSLRGRVREAGLEGVVGVRLMAELPVGEEALRELAVRRGGTLALAAAPGAAWRISVARASAPAGRTVVADSELDGLLRVYAAQLAERHPPARAEWLVALAHSWLGLAELRAGASGPASGQHRQRAAAHLLAAQRCWQSLGAIAEAEAATHRLRELADLR